MSTRTKAPILAVLGPKGGSAKSTLAVHLARALGSKARPSILADLDPQGAATSWLLTEPARGNLALDLEAGRPMRTTPAPMVPGVLVAAGDIDLASFDADFDRTRVRLPGVLAAPPGAACIVVDTPPSWGALVAGALAVADFVIVAVDCRTLGLVGLDRVLDLIEKVRERNRGLVFLGIAPQRVGRIRDSKRTEEILRERYKRVLPSVRESARIAELPARHSTIFDTSTETPARDDLDRLAQAVRRGMKGAQ